MSTVIRCDDCGKLNDEQGIGYVGNKWTLENNKVKMAFITVHRDLCKSCLKKRINSNELKEGIDGQY